MSKDSLFEVSTLENKIWSKLYDSLTYSVIGKEIIDSGYSDLTRAEIERIFVGLHINKLVHRGRFSVRDHGLPMYTLLQACYLEIRRFYQTKTYFPYLS